MMTVWHTEVAKWSFFIKPQKRLSLKYVWFHVKLLTEVVQGLQSDLQVLISYVRNADDCLPSFRKVSWIPGYSWSFSAPSFQVGVWLLSIDSFFLLISLSLFQNFVENLRKQIIKILTFFMAVSSNSSLCSHLCLVKIYKWLVNLSSTASSRLFGEWGTAAISGYWFRYSPFLEMVEQLSANNIVNYSLNKVSTSVSVWTVCVLNLALYFCLLTGWPWT